MATIATLSVSITARTKKFQKSMRRAAQRVKDFSKRIARLATIAGTVATAGLALLTKRAFTTIDALAKMSDNLSLSIRDLIGFRRAAEIAGIEANAFEKATAKMVIRIGEANQGLQQSKRAFEELGLDPADLELLSTREKLLTVIDALANMTNKTKALTLSYQIFSRQGIAFQQLVLAGAKSLEESVKRSEELGESLSRVDAAKIEAANDAIRDLGAVIRGVAQSIAIKLAPVIERVAKAITEWAIEGRRASNLILNGLKFVAIGASKVVDIFVILERTLVAIKLTGVRVFSFLTGVLTDFVTNAVNLLSRIPLIGDKFKIELGAVKAAAAIGKAAAEALVIETEKELTKLFSRKLPSENITAFFERLQAAAEAAAKAVADARKALPGGGDGDLPESLSSRAAARAAEFKQISLSRFGLGGITGKANKPQPIVSKQIDTTNTLLQQVVMNTLGPTTGAFAA